jgi:hypothetical protein
MRHRPDREVRAVNPTVHRHHIYRSGTRPVPGRLVAIVLALVIGLGGCATRAVYEGPSGPLTCTRPAPDVARYAGQAAVTTTVALVTAAMTLGHVMVLLDDGIGAAETARYGDYAACKSALEAAGYERIAP